MSSQALHFVGFRFQVPELLFLSSGLSFGTLPLQVEGVGSSSIAQASSNNSSQSDSLTVLLSTLL